MEKMNMKAELLSILRTEKRAVSGQELCERFGVSRTAVWKVIGQLKDEGYEIESVTNRGYELKAAPDRLTKHELESRLKDCVFGHEVLAYDSVPSTNQILKECMDDKSHGVLAIAEEQTMGKGRRGRTWQSPPGTGIWMSLLIKDLHQTDRGPMITIAAALAVKQAIDEILPGAPQSRDAAADGESPPEKKTLPEVRIKWPNDIVIGGKKICGILTEMITEVDYLHGIIVGIGINVHQEAFPAEIAETASSLYLATGKHFSRPELTERVMRCFEKTYGIFSRDQDLRNLCREYNRALVNAGEQIRVLDGDQSFCGIGIGIDDKGRLLVETEQGRKAVQSGEVSVRGIYGYT